MREFLQTWHVWIEALHVISVIAWMAGIFYLPRLFAYHADVPPGTDQDALFQKMERRLLRVIMNPAMILTWIFGLSLLYAAGYSLIADPWMGIKFAAVVLMTGFHMACAKWRRLLAAGRNPHPPRFYRAMNEVPTVLMIIIVIMIIVKPFA